ncbi:hypothetical protein CAY60_010500 [Shouchella clausii]|jgi:hypothetical protein|uniref:Uncharacterized protein n=2 Tax=Shouchella TaxID=2893057 RepID=Q5WEW0_SHOC1|nr:MULTISPECIES: hypothetical protein [Shouchella]MCM3313295.1 hypothetical protein [Psychrobacillus sp. MER TA 17]ALA54517.1 hypothetical protein DB29_03689 [Shouchella clausii]MBU3232375.1 hypothetical protein [Shouchella clausii]MBU3263410.1 hypothetical protein [Shouchella clausii]MBU3505875.1 hypothetical protein [Shouchella clausii]
MKPPFEHFWNTEKTQIQNENYIDSLPAEQGRPEWQTFIEALKAESEKRLKG